MSYVAAGICPKCGGIHTEIAVIDKGANKVQATCHDCGFIDMAVSSDDMELSVETAKRSFATLVVNDEGGVNVTGGGVGADALAETISQLVSVICTGRSCDECPLSLATPAEASAPSDPGGLPKFSPLKVQCSDMRTSNARTRLLKLFPGMPIEF